jgi:Ran GTPase-activating protein (RanGAP) involved in mRNA processing and transport
MDRFAYILVRLRQLEGLNLSANEHMTKFAVRQLVSALPNMPSLAYLALENCSLKDEGTEMIANTLPKTNIKVLNVRMNQIGIQGARSLSALLSTGSVGAWLESAAGPWTGSVAGE